jgi:hypothetical protein
MRAKKENNVNPRSTPSSNMSRDKLSLIILNAAYKGPSEQELSSAKLINSGLIAFSAAIVLVWYIMSKI